MAWNTWLSLGVNPTSRDLLSLHLSGAIYYIKPECCPWKSKTKQSGWPGRMIQIFRIPHYQSAKFGFWTPWVAILGPRFPYKTRPDWIEPLGTWKEPPNLAPEGNEKKNRFNQPVFWGGPIFFPLGVFGDLKKNGWFHSSTWIMNENQKCASNCVELAGGF